MKIVTTQLYYLITCISLIFFFILKLLTIAIPVKTVIVGILSQGNIIYCLFNVERSVCKTVRHRLSQTRQFDSFNQISTTHETDTYQTGQYYWSSSNDNVYVTNFNVNGVNSLRLIRSLWFLFNYIIQGEYMKS